MLTLWLISFFYMFLSLSNRLVKFFHAIKAFQISFKNVYTVLPCRLAPKLI